MDVISYVLSKKYTDEKCKEMDNIFQDYKNQSMLKTIGIEKELNDFKNTLHQVNVNQEAKQSTSGYGIVDLPKNAANGQVSVSVEGLTVSSLLGTDGDFSSGTDKLANGWEISHSGFPHSYNEIEKSQSFSIPYHDNYLYYNLNINNGHKYFIRFLLKKTIEEESKLTIGFENTAGMTLKNHTTITSDMYNVETYAEINKILLPAADYSFIGFSGINGIKCNAKIKDMTLVDLTELFGAGNEPTVEQCKQMFDGHVSGTKSTISSARIKSVGKNLFEIGEFEDLEYTGAYHVKKVKLEPNVNYTISANNIGEKLSGAVLIMNNKSYHAATKCFIAINSTGVATRNTFNTESDDWYLGIYLRRKENPREHFYLKFQNYNIQLERGDRATEYEPYKESTAYVVAKDKDNKIVNLKRINDGIYDELDLDNRELVKRTGDLVLDGTENWQDRGLLNNGLRRFSLNSKITYKSSGSNVIEIYCDTLPVQPSVEAYNIARDRGICIYRENDRLIYLTLNDGETPQTILSENPATLIYQLAEPEIIPIQVSRNIVSNPSGTIYIEQAVADANVYNNGVTIFEQELNIDYIDKLYKIDYQTGVKTEIDASKAVIAEDKKSFTHPDLVNGDMVFFEYYYSNETTQGETTIEYYDSRYVIPDKTLPNKFYKWDIEVDNGVPSVAVTEV